MGIIMNEFIGIGVCGFLAFVYVSSLYVWELIYPKIRSLGRDDPKVIKRRCISVLVSVFVTGIITQVFTGTAISFPCVSFHSLFLTVGQTLMLMAGPISHRLASNSQDPPRGWILIRTLIIAPVSEELVFRDWFLKIMTTSRLSVADAMFIGPFIFALAHVHHSWRKVPIISSMMAVAHTCLFGWIAFYFLTNRSVYDAIISHAICNVIGLPNSRTSVNKFTLISVYITGLALFLVSLTI
jgi:prenyl protein peptidase